MRIWHYESLRWMAVLAMWCFPFFCALAQTPQPLRLYHGKEALGVVHAYDTRSGYRLPLGELSAALGLGLRVSVGDGLAEGVLAGQDFQLDTLAHTIHFAGKSERFEPGLVISDSKDLYVDASLLAAFFPFRLYVDASSLTLHIRLKKSLTDSQKSQLRALWQHPVQPPKAPLAEDAMLLLQPMVKNQAVGEIVEVYQVNGQLYAPLHGLANALGFPIYVDLINGTAKGWLRDKNHRFSLNLAKGIAKASGKTYPIKPLTKDGDIYVDIPTLAMWFNVQMEVSYADMALRVESDLALPFERKNQRVRYKKPRTPHYPLKPYPYRLAGWPFIDINANQEQRDTTYSLQSAGDLGYLTTTSYLAGNQEAVQNFRLKGERSSLNADLLGRLHATHYALGDIDSLTVPLVAQNSLGRGVSVSNRPVSQTAEFDRTEFSGNAQPGWEIELYRNETLLDFRTIGNDGRYRFTDVPVLYGNNTFRLVFYGPQGQIEEQVKQVFADGTTVKAGNYYYEMSLDDKSNDLFGLQDNTALTPEGFRAIGTLEYGLSDRLSLRFNSITTPLQDGTHDYLSTGIRAGLGNALASADLAYDTTNAAWATKFTALTGIDDINIKLEQRFFDHFVSEERNPLSLLPDSQSELDLNSYIKLPLLHEMNTGVNILYEQFPGFDRTTFSNRLGKSVLGVNISHTLGVVVSNQQQLLQGSLALRGGVKGVLLGGMVSYHETIDSLSLTAQKNLNRDVFGRINLVTFMDTGKLTQINTSVTWDFYRFQLSALAQADDNGEVFTGLGVTISLAKLPGGSWYAGSRPMAYNGAILGRSYLDKNYNAVLDGDDEILPNPVMKLDNRSVEGTKGRAFAPQLLAKREVTVSLDKDGLPDPLWMPGVKGYTLQPRPGAVFGVDFPVFAIAEIDGTVSVEGLPANRFTVILQDKTGHKVQSTQTQYDGYYGFSQVLPGEYRIVILKKHLRRYHLATPTAETITVQGGEVYNGRDITLHRK